MSQPQSDASILIIVGMHRSGTSFVASLLKSAGLFIGDRLLPANEGNLKGYFENQDFYDLHRAILRSQGINEAGWTLQENITVEDVYREQAQHLIEQHQSFSCWGWKEPRTTLLLDFWADLLPHAHFLMVYRAPWDVVDSLYRRGDDTFHKHPDLAIKVWLHYNQKILDFYTRYPDRCLLTNIHTIIDHSSALIERLQDPFGLSLQTPDLSLFDPNLFQTQQDQYLVSLINHYCPDGIEHYQHLQNRAWHPLESSADRSETVNVALHTVAAFNHWMQLRASQQQVQALQTWVEHHQAERQQYQIFLAQQEDTWRNLEQRTLQLQTVQTKLQELEASAQAKDTVIAQMQQQFQHYQSELFETRARLQQSHEKLEELQVSYQQTQAELEQTQQDLQFFEHDLEQTRSHSQQTQTNLEQSQRKLLDTEAVLEQAIDQLHHTETVLEQTFFQLQTTFLELDQSRKQYENVTDELAKSQLELRQNQLQLHSTEVALEQVQQQLFETESVLMQSQHQLQQTEDLVTQYQAQLQQTQESVNRSQLQKQQMTIELTNFQTQYQQTQMELQFTQTQLFQVQQELEQSRSQHRQDQRKWERSYLQQSLVYQLDNPEHIEYQLLVWDAWDAYRNQEMDRMVGFLRRSLTYTDRTKTETISDWLNSFSRLFNQQGAAFDSHALTKTTEWQKFVQRLMVSRV